MPCKSPCTGMLRLRKGVCPLRGQTPAISRIRGKVLLGLSPFPSRLFEALAVFPFGHLFAWCDCAWSNRIPTLTTQIKLISNQVRPLGVCFQDIMLDNSLQSVLDATEQRGWRGMAWHVCQVWKHVPDTLSSHVSSRSSWRVLNGRVLHSSLSTAQHPGQTTLGQSHPGGALCPT